MRVVAFGDQVGPVLYRYEDVLTAAPVDEFDRPMGESTVQVYLRRFPIVRTTAKGAWIDVYGERRFVLLTARKRFACESVEAARESFIARKQAQRRIYTARLRSINRAIEAAERL